MMKPILSLDHVRKSCWRGLHETVVLGDVSLDVRAGELMAIWGRRGSGKTTLARLAAGLEAPDKGVVRFRGEDMAKARRGGSPLLHREIGWVRRSGPGSNEIAIVEYVALPLLDKFSPRQARRHAMSILARLGVADSAAANWGSLTDGQRTLVAIAHALVRDPTLIVADDPTAYLDGIQRDEVMMLLRSACDSDGLAVLITVPDMPELARANQIGSLSDGHLVLAPPADEADGNVIDFPGRERSA